VEPEEVESLFAQRGAVVTALREAGYAFVALDLEGYSTGKLNATWRPGTAR